MKFVIRDDDINYFSKPSDIIRWYEDIFAEHIPVGFATIPYVKPISDVYTNNAPNEDREFPLSRNTELVAYMKNNPLIEVIQHGCTHETKQGIFEYQKNTSLLADTARGKTELEHALERSVSLFAPPHDWIGTQGIKAIEAAHLHVIRGRGAGLRNIIVRKEYVLIFIKMVLFKARYLLRKTIPAYPFVLDFGLHKEVCSYRLEDHDVFEGLDYAHKKDGIFVVVTHLHFYTDEKKKVLRELIKKAREYNADFVLPSVLFK